MGSFFDDTVVFFLSFSCLWFIRRFFTPSSFSGSLAQNSFHHLSDRHSASTSEKYLLFCDLLVRVGSAKNSKKMQKKRKKRSRGDIGTPRPTHYPGSRLSRCIHHTRYVGRSCHHLSFSGSFCSADLAGGWLPGPQSRRSRIPLKFDLVYYP